MSKSVFCIANQRNQAEQIVEDLQDAGFPLTDISILYPDASGRHDITHEKHTKAPEGATAGAATGGIAGGVLGLLAIPGIGPFIAAGPIMAALSGAAVGAATGGLLGGLIGLGIPEVEAKHYETKLKEGNYFISVHTTDADEVDRVKEIFKAANAEDIGVTTEEAVTSVR
jgi:uncharacterized membrane protein